MSHIPNSHSVMDARRHMREELYPYGDLSDLVFHQMVKAMNTPYKELHKELKEKARERERKEFPEHKHFLSLHRFFRDVKSVLKDHKEHKVEQKQRPHGLGK